MKYIDQLYELSEIKDQFEQLQKQYQIHFPKVDPNLVYDLLLRNQKESKVMPMYTVEIFTKKGIDTNAVKQHIYNKTGMSAAVYDNGTHYVTNQRLTLEILKEMSDREEVLEVYGEYTGSCASIGASHEFRNQINSKYNL